MLLVHDDEPGLAHRRKDGAARADHDARPAGLDAMPLVVPLALRKAAVQHGHLIARLGEAALNRSTVCGVSEISGTSTNAPRPAIARHGDRLQVNLRLAAARHAVEEHGLMAPPAETSSLPRWRRAPLSARGPDSAANRPQTRSLRRDRAEWSRARSPQNQDSPGPATSGGSCPDLPAVAPLARAVREPSQGPQAIPRAGATDGKGARLPPRPAREPTARTGAP